jgi:hypothetical protein
LAASFIYHSSGSFRGGKRWAFRFHDLRGIHPTALLDASIPVHTVAQRIGDDPAVLLRTYTKRKRSKQANERLSDKIAGLAAGFLGARR